MGKPDSELNRAIWDQEIRLLNDIPDFNYVRLNYLDSFDVALLKELDIFVSDIINADNTITSEENHFYKDIWSTYLDQRINN